MTSRLLTNVPAHFNEIYADVEEAREDLNHEDYFGYGENIGEVLVLAVGVVSSEKYTDV